MCNVRLQPGAAARRSLGASCKTAIAELTFLEAQLTYCVLLNVVNVSFPCAIITTLKYINMLNNTVISTDDDLASIGLSQSSLNGL